MISLESLFKRFYPSDERLTANQNQSCYKELGWQTSMRLKC